MNEPQFEKALMATLSEAPGEYTSGWALDIKQVARVQTLEDAGVLNRNCGLVVTMNDGSEFQVTIVQSRNARG